MRILVTGGAGYIGSHVVAVALKKNHEVEILDSMVRGRMEAVRRAAELADREPPRVHRIDLCDVDAVASVVSREFDAVLHCAAFKSVEESTREPALYERNNERATSILGDSCVTAGIQKLVFASTGCIYGGVAPFKEGDPLLPMSPYALSKVRSEDWLRGLPLPVVSLRFFNVCGAHSSGHLGEFPGFTTNLMPLLVEQLGRDTPRITVFGDDYDTYDGTCIRDYVHVMDVADAIVTAATLDTGASFRVYNVGTGRGSSVMEVISAVERASGVSFERTIGSRRAGDPHRLVADVSRAGTELEWTAQHTLVDMAKSAVNWATTLSISRT